MYQSQRFHLLRRQGLRKDELVRAASAAGQRC